MDLRRDFVLAASAPEANVAEQCRRFGISRGNGYKWLGRFKAQGEVGLEERSRRPISTIGVSGEIVLRLIELRRQYPNWGPKKLQRLLLREGVESPPSTKTLGRILDRAGEARVRRPRRRLRLILRERELLKVEGPNDVWTVDFKGWWRVRGGQRYEPLTVRDAFSRFVLCLRMIPSMAAKDVKPVFERLFQANGLPKVIRVDNGAPFACTSAPAGFSRLSAWWTSLGIQVSFSRPAHPQDNGSHERMHLDVANELESNPAGSLETQQRIATAWRKQFNTVRPHEALGMRTPEELYRRSSRPYRGVRRAVYPSTLSVRLVSKLGCVRYAGKIVFVSESVGGFEVGVRKTRKGLLSVRFYGVDLGTFDLSAAPAHRRPALTTPNLIPKNKRATA